MRFTFDHIVHFVEEPSKAIAIFKENGIHAVEGGKHLNYGTYNALSYFDLSYIEFLSTYDRDLLERTKHLKNSFFETVVRDRYKEGFSRVAIRTTDIEEAAHYFRKKGLTVNGPVPMNRKRPDGSVIEWKLLYIGDEDEGLELPFIIQWNESDEDRRNQLTEKKAIMPHPAGTTFSHVNFAVKDLKNTVEKWSNWLDLKAGKEFINEDLQARCQTIQLPGGNFVFCCPIGDGIVSEALKNQGEKPFQVNLSSDKNESAFELLGGIYTINEH
ncbi:VOC family protein [Bacillus sp. FJAT-29790]|uniref:VOC family protein n=1 Tax=Bacillus sp. FJAT-29790 TaxID=1895002 RepID=UPI001C21FF87|nr:VOC family protein [Bacillus sp. FJAT-29790]MBU8880442.1 VOC family protein [Bacillus sp. FJAT-29790]